MSLQPTVGLDLSGGVMRKKSSSGFSVLAQKSGAAAFHNYLNNFGPNAPPSSAVIESDSEEEEDEAGEGEGE